jgi:ABC-type nitrate/sulfonate/bicarbonate transport system substrate-binding protein
MSRKWAIGIGLTLAAALIILAGAYLWQAGMLSCYQVPEKITIGSNPGRYSGPVYVAQERGYFKAQGLDVTIKTNISSPESIKDLKAGRLDLACCGAFNLVQEALAGPSKIRCLAILANGQIFNLIVRPDKGISRPEDLRGKTIGLPRRTAAEFFLGRFLAFNRIAFNEVNIMDINPSDLAGSLAAGKVDAVVAWEETAQNIKDKIGDQVVTWPCQEGQDIYWLLTSGEDYLKDKPEILEKVLRALEDAVNFIKHSPQEARGIISQRSKFSPSEWDSYPLRYEVFLDQNLLLVLEDEAAWMIRNHFTDQTTIPNFMDYLAPGPLWKVDPRAMRLVMSGQKPPN